MIDQFTGVIIFSGIFDALSWILNPFPQYFRQLLKLWLQLENGNSGFYLEYHEQEIPVQISLVLNSFRFDTYLSIIDVFSPNTLVCCCNNSLYLYLKLVIYKNYCAHEFIIQVLSTHLPNLRDYRFQKVWFHPHFYFLLSASARCPKLIFSTLIIHYLLSVSESNFFVYRFSVKLPILTYSFRHLKLTYFWYFLIALYLFYPNF